MKSTFRFFVGVLVALSSSAAFAQFKVQRTGSSVSVNNITILTLRSGNNDSRAETVAASFAKLTPDSILQLGSTGKGKNQVFHIRDGDRVVLTATLAEAKAQGTSSQGLANSWLSRLKRATSQPPLQISTDTVRVATGQVKRVKVEGFLASKVKIELDNESVLSLRRQDGDLIIGGKKLGEAIVTLSVGKFTKHLKVSVQPPALDLPQTVTMTVTGNPATAETVRGAIESALWTKLAHSENAEYKFQVPTISGLTVGSSVTYKVPVSGTAPNAVPVDGVFNVVVKNQPIASRQEADLWYCNDPENVRTSQNLFAAQLNLDRPVRMLYHHMNASAAPLYLEVTAVNESSKPARVVIIPGDAKPHLDPVKAGLQAGDQFFRNWLTYSGEIVVIPPRSSIPITVRRVAPQETMSGLCHLRLLDGPESILIRTDSKAPYESDGRLTAALNSSAPWQRLPPQKLTYNGNARVELSDHVYPTPYKTEVINYVIGGRYGFVRLGQRPIPRQDGKGLEGNFGVVYTIEATVENPTADNSEVEVVFEASAGYSGAIFVVNGELRKSNLLQTKEEVQVAKLKIGPGEKRMISIMTFPLSGSSYPATLVFRPVGTGLAAVKIHN